MCSETSTATDSSALESLRTDLTTLPAHKLVSKYVLDRVPHMFDTLDQSIDWRIDLAERLSVDPSEIVVVGTAAVGHSFNPRKNLRPFDGASDVDVAVVSARHFEVAWNHLRRIPGSTRARLRGAVKTSLIKHAPRDVYWGVIATDRILSLLPFASQWMDGLIAMSRVEPTSGRDVNARIYRDFHALRTYQTIGVRELANSIREDEEQ